MYGSFLCVLSFFVFAPFAHAQDVGAIVGGIGDGIAGALGTIIYPLAHTLGMVIVGIGGFALNMAIQKLIIGWGGIYNGDFGINIQQIWVIIRDLFNLLFIFSFIFLGIKTILNSDDSSTKRAIGHIIVAALFINFSLFIALTVIDFSNILATQIYNQLIYSGIRNEAGQVQGDITGAFMEAASIGSFLATPPPGTSGTTILFYAIFMLIFFIVTGIIFLFGTYHVLYRFVVLTLCLILSPVLFVGLILPNFKKFSSQWIETLLRQSFFAPAFLFLLYVSLQVLTTLKVNFGGTSGVGYTTILEGKGMTPDAFTIFMMFGLTIGFLYAAVKVGDTMGIAGAKTTLSALDKTQKMGRQFLGNAAGGIAFGGAAAFLRGTVGKAAHDASESDALRDAASQRTMRGFIARRQLEASRVVGDASFDVRRVGNFGKNTGLGEGRKGGYKSHSEEIEKKAKAYAKELGEVGDDDPRVQQFMLEKDNLEEALKEAKIAEKKAVTPEDKEDAARAVDKAERDLKKVEEKIKNEKSRRQTGTYVDPAIAASTKKAFIENKGKIDDLKKKFKALGSTPEDEAQKLKIAEEIIELNKKQKDIAYEAKEKDGTLGYAGVLEKRGFWASLAMGRLAVQNHEAGKAVRKQYEKAAKKTKEDAREDALKETVEKAVKKE